MKLVILGGTGKMGRWLAKFLKNKGYDVAIHSRSPERAATTSKELQVKYIKSLDEVQDADIVIVSTSLSSTADVIRDVSKRMKPNSILFDLASVKGGIIEALEEAKSRGIRAISVHPMFGPGTTSLEGKHVLVVPIGTDSELINEITNLFEGVETHLLPSGEVHDTMIALTLSLSHFINIVFGQTLSHSNIRELFKFAGTTFTLQLLLTEAVFSEDPDLYYEIQSQNVVFGKTLDVFIKSVKDVALTIKKKDRKSFVNYFNQARSSLSKDPNFPKAYIRFYKAYEAIT
ncbi:MAG: prephenate dehydrogenase/arogenate dehydrogenase family protein [Candidatus Bathyarchaeota archaeon]